MTDRTLATIEIEEKPEGFFFSLDDGASLAGPFETQEAAIEAASELLGQSFGQLLEQALFGEQK